MEHLDEGMAHAWIDGELSAREALAVETHVRTCDECAIIVAEARGLVAATSRIVSQLDQVPAGVIPTVATTRPASVRTRRTWWRHPAFAAAAVLGVTTLSWLSLRGTPGTVAAIAGARAPAGDMPSAAPAAAASTSASTSEIADALDSNAPAAARDRRLPVGITGAIADAGASAPRRAVRDVSEPTRMPTPKPSTPRISAPTADAAASAPTPSAPTANAEKTMAQARASEQSAGASAAALASAPTAVAARASTLAARSVDAASAVDSGTRPSLAGCYLLARSETAARAATMQLPSRIRLTDSVRATADATPTFLAYGMRDGTATAIPLLYRRVSASTVELSPAFGDAFADAAFVRVLVVAADGVPFGNASSDAEFVARRQPCP